MAAHQPARPARLDDATPYFGTMHQRHFGDRGQAEWLEGLMDELVRSGAARREGDVLVNI
jgi:hypothetical protein